MKPYGIANLETETPVQPLSVVEPGDYRGPRVIEHGGFTGTYMLRLQDDRLTVIVLPNLDLASGNMPVLIACSVAGIIDPKYIPVHRMSPDPNKDPDISANIANFSVCSAKTRRWI